MRLDAYLRSVQTPQQIRDERLKLAADLLARLARCGDLARASANRGP